MIQFRRLAMAAVSAAALVLLLPVPSHAQQAEVGGWLGYGSATQVTTDLTVCTINGCAPSWSSRQDRPRAVGGGVDVRVAATRWLALRAGLDLAPKGHGVGQAGDLRVASLYLELPVIVDVRLIRLGPAELWLGAGMAPATLLSCRVHTAERGYPYRSYETPCGQPDPVNGLEYGPTASHDLSWILAPAIRVPLEHGSLALEARASRGLLDITPVETGSTRNRGYFVAVWYGFEI
jgi:hypothetical protein